MDRAPYLYQCLGLQRQFMSSLIQTTGVLPIVHRCMPLLCHFCVSGLYMWYLRLFPALTLPPLSPALCHPLFPLSSHLLPSASPSQWHFYIRPLILLLHCQLSPALYSIPASLLSHFSTIPSAKDTPSMSADREEMRAQHEALTFKGCCHEKLSFLQIWWGEKNWREQAYKTCDNK